MPTLVLLSALAVETYLLLHDVPLLGPSGPRASASPSPPLAELMTRENDVQVQDAGGVVWERAERGRILHRRESVLTLERGRAEIAFLDGTGIVLGENSLIQIERSPGEDGSGLGKLVVRLLHGSIHKGEPRQTPSLLRTSPEQTTPRLEIQVGDARAEVPAETELDVSLAPGASPSFEIKAGRLAIETPQGEVRVGAGQIARLGAKSQVVEAPWTPVYPGAAQAVATGVKSEVNVAFRWQAPHASRTREGSELVLEASSDPAFTRDVHRARVPASAGANGFYEASLALAAPREATRMHWRVREGERELGNPAGFWLDPPKRPVLLYPPAGARAESMRPAEFAWQAFEGSNGYELELAARDGTVPPRTQRVPTNHFRGNLAVDCAGTCELEWRVRAALVDGTSSAWSEPRVLRVDTPANTRAPAARSPLAPPPPPTELEDPEFDETTPAARPRPLHSWLEWLMTDAIADEGAAPADQTWSVKLRWKAVAGAKGYRIQVARTRGFERIIAEGQSGEPEWSWPYRLGIENSRGRVFYRIASVGEDGQAGAFSAPRAIQVPAEILAKARVAAREKAEATRAEPIEPAARRLERYKAVTEGESTAPEAAEQKVEAPLAPTSDVVTVQDLSEDPQAGAVTASRLVPIRDTERTRMLLRGSLGAGVGNLHQSGGGDGLTAVDMDGAYLQQYLKVDGDFFLAGIDPRRYLEATLAVDGAHFTASNQLPRISQPAATDLRFRLDLASWTALRPLSVERSSFSDDPESVAADSWSWGWGLAIDRDFEWVRSGAQAVAPADGLSVGPSLMFSRRDRVAPGSGLGTYDAGMRVGLPVSGAATGSFWGARASLWQEWKLCDLFARSWLGGRLEAELDYKKWGGDHAAAVSAWSIWIAPTFHFAAF